ncbi:hypothetical protein CAEBREN_14336 [Caenorhabditis brenneri]|uniref:Uncharacterized protein n=1 Tax=Caenorhabditis brenneri TaxID=135651 RepID=G0NJG2_CAEBE|nr:hypothetical protein CAEBREN_14336 [Caenorhabditis brenneri]
MKVHLFEYKAGAECLFINPSNHFLFLSFLTYSFLFTPVPMEEWKKDKKKKRMRREHFNISSVTLLFRIFISSSPSTTHPSLLTLH